MKSGYDFAGVFALGNMNASSDVNLLMGFFFFFFFFRQAAAAVLLLASASGQALPISADFRTEADVPSSAPFGPLVHQSLSQSLGLGYELDRSDFVENPSVWNGGIVLIDFDPDNYTLTLDSQDTHDFQTFTLWIDNIEFDTVGEYIASVNIISNELTDPGLQPTISYTDNSLSINYLLDAVFEFTGQSASFEIETNIKSVAVPEPGSLALIAIGVAGLFTARRPKAEKPV